MFVWENNDFGQTNVPSAARSGVTAIAVGARHVVALKNDGSVVAWGAGEQGQTTTPTNLAAVTAIAAGAYHTVALVGASFDTAFLNVKTSGNEMILSWPVNATGFKLQSTPTLNPPVTWTDFPSTPNIIGGRFTVTSAISVGNKFYRLEK